MRQKKSQLDENIRKTREEKQKMEIPKVSILLHGNLRESTMYMYLHFLDPTRRSI